MHDLVIQFSQALRNADVPISPLETLDALAVVEAMGVDDRDRLHDALALTMAKSPVEKHRFDVVFDQFFHDRVFAEQPKRTLLNAFDHERLIDALERLDPAAAEVGELILDARRAELALRVREYALESNMQDMTSLRDKAALATRLAEALHAPALRDAQRHLIGQGEGELAAGAGYLYRYVGEQVKAFADVQYALLRDPTGKRQILEAATSGALDGVSPEYRRNLEAAVSQIAARLVHQYKKRKRRTRKHSGPLDIRRMLRRSMAYDGHLMELHRQARHRKRGTVFVICDVSGSVARVTRFFLLMLYQLQDVLPKMRTFAFSNALGEVTATLSQGTTERAIEEVLFDWGNGTTDYGSAFSHFRDLVDTDLDNRSTVIVLGDGRANYYDPRLGVFKGIAGRARRIMWLNPEARTEWGTGDSEMLRYASHCLHTQRLSSLQDLSRFADRLVSLTS